MLLLVFLMCNIEYFVMLGDNDAEETRRVSIALLRLG